MMRSFIVCNNDAIGTRIRQILVREGHDCPIAQVISPDLATNDLTCSRPDLVVLPLSAEPERALKLLSELRALTQARILAVGPGSDSKLVLAALRGGAEDYIDEADLEAELLAALSRNRGTSTAPVQPGRVIGVLAPNGGSGSSTLAANIGIVLAKEHKRALLFDLKLETGDLAALLDLKPTHTLADLCQNAARMDRVMFEHSLVQHASGVHLLPPPRTLAEIRHVTSEGVRQALVQARTLFPYVVADLDHSFREEQLQVLRQADVLLLVLRLDFVSLRNAHRTLEHLDQLDIGKERVRLVASRYGQPKEVPASKAEEALGTKIFHYVPDDPKTVNRANNSGIPVVLESPSAKVSKSVTRLAISINGQHKDR
jgi:pilus assembly protein CpaE